ncbi:hypothetical protein B0H34DRAFT_859634 [Crassisporium funariophilum]|nr:hypothetical protein B0H34DRAFT_859634 [Crassisporium funariophilum]
MDYCLSCFGISKPTDNERDPLLPKHTQRRDQRGRRGNDSQDVERPMVDKVVDVLAALNAGKLPSQAQFTHILQASLRSDLLTDDRGKVVPGNGPMSKQGRKVLGDVRDLVQALLRFGLEKNSDDKLQEVYFQILQIDAPPVPAVNVDVSGAKEAGQAALDATQQGASEVKDQVPAQDELAFDTSTFLHALRTLLETSLSSSVFRLVLVDLFSIARDLLAHAAADVGHAALRVQQAAEEVEKKAREGDDVIAEEDDGELKVNVSIDDLKDKGKATVDKIQTGAKDMKNEWQGVVEDVSDKTKEKILQRMQQVITRIQRDPASHSAINAMLILARKYAEKFASASDAASSAVVDAARHTSETLTSGMNGTNYPPQPYESQQPETPSLDVTSLALLQDVKEVLQRLGQGHSLDALLAASKRVVRDLNDVPTVLGDELSKTLEDKVDQAGEEAQPSPTPGNAPPTKGKGKHKKKKGRKGWSTDKHKLQEETTMSPSESQGQMSPIGHNTENPLRTYFSRIGAYLDEALEKPGWAMSKDGAKLLESLFDEGVELVNVVGESIIDLNPKDEDIRRQFKKDLKNLMNEAEIYVTAVERDKTTMRVLRVLEVLGEDLSGLMFQGTKKGRRTFARSVAGMRGWTDWIGWAIPRLMRMIPGGMIPIPSVEVKTGNIEGGLYALFVQGLGRGGGGDPVGTKIVPDRVVLKEWTEVRIDMAEHEHPSGGQPTRTSPSASKPGIHSTSRVHMHLDGVRAKVEGMGYYFKYTGGMIGYEDEGVLSVDVGMGALHDGLGADVEVEIESDNIEFDTGPNIPEIIIEGEYDQDEVANLDVQEAVATKGSACGMERDAAVAAGAPAEPLFRVIDVKIAMRGLKFKIDKSRHWMLNKLLLQPLAGPVVARVIRQAVEEKVHAGLLGLALSLGAVAKDAKRKGEIRRAKERARIMQKHPVGGMGLEEEEELEEGLAEILADWWGAVLQNGPLILGYDNSGKGEEDAEEVDVETTTRTDATMKGLIYTSSTSTTTAEQPRGSPAMMYNKATRSMERVDLTLEAIAGESSASSQHQDEDETVVAVGGGAQLFPGKGGPYGEDGERQGLLEGIRDGVKKAVDGAVQGLNEGEEVVDRVENRWGKSKKAEERSTETWKSKAFDF